jgi:hypothetical protein
MADKAEVAGSGHKKMCGCGPGKDSMRREEDAEGKARDSTVPPSLLRGPCGVSRPCETVSGFLF